MLAVPPPETPVVAEGAEGGADAADSDSDDDIPLTQRSKVLAKKWVEKNKINTDLDKDADALMHMWPVFYPCSSDIVRWGE